MIDWRHTHRRSRFIALLALALLGGCRSSSPQPTEAIAGAIRYSGDGAESLATGNTHSAIRSFRRAIHRSWASDDPFHAGTNAYNLAAALFANEDHESALCWLIDARVELHRAGASAGNTYLLEAKIAQAEGRIADAGSMIALASCSAPPCSEPAQDQPVACRPSKLACVPWLGAKLEERKAIGQCADDYQAQVHLARSRLAAESYQLALASQHLGRAKLLAKDVCSSELRAEIHHATALIELAHGSYLNAAVHFDREADAWRVAGTYRKIPDVLQLAAAAYLQIERFDLASDRLCRSARCLFAQGKYHRSWDVVQQAFTFVELDATQSSDIRLMLTANEIESQLADQADGKPRKFGSHPQRATTAPTADQEILPAELLPSS